MSRPVLIDSCIWIDFFNHNRHRDLLEWISAHLIPATNGVILAEVVPGLLHARQENAARLLQGQRQLELAIDWPGIIDLQVRFLKKGINKVGIIDLVIIQNAMQNEAAIASLDGHMKQMCKETRVKLIEV